MMLYVLCDHQSAGASRASSRVRRLAAAAPAELVPYTITSAGLLHSDTELGRESGK